MKCGICGHRCNTIGAMGKHYRKKHPRSLKARKPKSSKGSRRSSRSGDLSNRELLEMLVSRIR